MPCAPERLVSGDTGRPWETDLLVTLDTQAPSRAGCAPKRDPTRLSFDVLHHRSTPVAAELQQFQDMKNYHYKKNIIVLYSDYFLIIIRKDEQF